MLDVDDLVGGNDVFFAATGVTDGDVMQGVRYLGDGHATTDSLVMRSRSGTVREVKARHDRPKLREVTGGRYGWGGAARRAARGQSPRALERVRDRVEDLAYEPASTSPSVLSCSSYRKALITAPASRARLRR